MLSWHHSAFACIAIARHIWRPDECLYICDCGHAILWCWVNLSIWVAPNPITKFAQNLHLWRVVLNAPIDRIEIWRRIILLHILRLTQTSNCIFKICQKELPIGKIQHNPIISLWISLFYAIRCTIRHTKNEIKIIHWKSLKVQSHWAFFLGMPQ
jgi:hypothetical protein